MNGCFHSGIGKLGRFGVALAVAAGVVTTILLAGCGRGAEAAPKTAAAPATQAAAVVLVPVKVKPAVARELQRSVRIVGSLAGIETATLSNRVTGTIGKIHVDMGDRVKPNAVLLEIVPRRYELGLQEAEAALMETLARLGVKEVPSENFDVAATAPVKKAQSELDNAKSKLDRQTPLYAQKVIKEFEYFDTESAYKVAQSALEASRDEARALLAQARQNQAEIEIKRKDFKDATIMAPDGATPEGVAIDSYAVTSRKVSTGEYLKEGTMLFTLVADGILKLQARVPERHLGTVAKGARVTFGVEAFPGETFEGTVNRIDPSVDPANRTFMIEALVENGTKYHDKLRPGSFVQGEVLTKKEPDRVLVPLEAVTSFVGVTKVYILDAQSGGEKKVHSVEVKTGQQEDQWVEILPAEDGAATAVKPGDLVVFEGMRKLVEGALVRVQNADAVK